MSKTKINTLELSLSIFLITIIGKTNPVQLHRPEHIDNNQISDSNTLQQCLGAEDRSNDIGVCFGGEMLNKLRELEEEESFSLASGVNFVRDEKMPRDFGALLDKDPMDFRSIIEGASSLISRRSMQWDMSVIYPGLTMRIGPTLANGVMDFIIDTKTKDRGFNSHGGLSTGRFLTKQLLVPFLLGFKFQLSTLLPILLGLILFASKKAFLLAKLAIVAVTVFGSGGFGGGGDYGGGGFGTPGLSSFGASYSTAPGYQPHLGSNYYTRQPHGMDPYYREKSSDVPGMSHHHDSDQSTDSPLTPEELKHRLERLFNSNTEVHPRENNPNIRDSRSFAWRPASINFKTQNDEN